MSIPSLSERMHALAKAGHTRARELTRLATDLDQAMLRLDHKNCKEAMMIWNEAYKLLRECNGLPVGIGV